MTLNNPFIRYKIYSTPNNAVFDTKPLSENVRVTCVISENESLNQDFLIKILSAAQIPDEEYQIVKLNTEMKVSASELGWFKKLDYILYFGVYPKVMDIHIPVRTYEISKLHQTSIIQLPQLQKIESDKSEKQKLWQLLKKEFIDD